MQRDWAFSVNHFSIKTTYPARKHEPNKIFSNHIETSREGNDRTFHVIFCPLSKNFDNLELYLKIFGIFEPSLVCLSGAWVSNVP